ncbi:hypothetical protein [Desulfoluna sp.]|uniref:hypothetical protein n=1 Tax=Desulfoluna sp. TaxID=2045199 RepID=UPI0026110B13|nr:hypothetical protein [Desulfoluna sp.]
MAFSALVFRQSIAHVFFLSAFFASVALATPEPMKEWELGGVEAGTGVNIGFENLTIQRSGGTSTFFPDYDPTKEVDEQTEFISFADITGERTVNGNLSIEVGAYEAPQRDWFVKDTAKVRVSDFLITGLNDVYDHRRKDYTLVKASDYKTDAESRGVHAVILNMGNGTDVFMSQDSSMGLSFSASEYRIPGSNGFTQDAFEVDSGTLSITGMKTFGQRVTIYPLGDIPGFDTGFYPPGEIPNYVTGEGIALEIRSKSSIDEIKLTALDGTVNALVKGVHLRESFNQDVHNLYGKWGDMSKDYFKSDAPAQYLGSTYDPDGYYGTQWDPKDTPINPSLIKTPYEGGPDYYNMYDGYMMNGNINQVGFYDLVGGKKMPFEHGQSTDNDTITARHFGEVGGLYKLEDDYQLRDQGRANAIAIEERPMTIQVKTGRTYQRYDAGAGELVDYYDDRSYVAINWPRHGSVRVEEIQGYLSAPDEGPYKDFGPSMGSVILDGMRAKKTYIEIPGRAEQYLITEQNMHSDGTRHNYVYDAGILPDEMNSNGLPSWGQPDWDPIGRGQLDFLSKLGNTSLNKPSTTPNLNPTGGRWDLYDISKSVGGVTYDFWHLYEPDYPGASARWIPDH